MSLPRSLGPDRGPRPLPQHALLDLHEVWDPWKHVVLPLQPHVAPGLRLILTVFSEAVTVPGGGHVLTYTCVTDEHTDAFLPKR